MLDNLNGLGEFKPMDKQADDDVMHVLAFGKADGFSVSEVRAWCSPSKRAD